MAREKEIKIKLVGLSLEEFIAKIRKGGFKLQKTISQKDTYFDTPDWFLYQHLSALRLRSVDNQDHSFSFKKLFATPGKRDFFHIEEIEVPAPFSDSTSLAQIFFHLGLKYANQKFSSAGQISDFLIAQAFQDEQQMTKIRRIFTKETHEIVIDDVDQVGVIIELECQDSEPLDLMQTLLTDSQWIRDLEGTSFTWLKNVKGFTSHIKNFDRFKIEPDWNVLPHERQMYQKLSKSNL